jgi:nucleoside-diphosphate-sugar epimerase
MKILVTGSEGSLGQAVIPKLLLKHEVRGVDSLVRYGQRPSSSGEMSYEFVMGDLADYSVRHRRHHHCTAALVAGATALPHPTPPLTPPPTHRRSAWR